MSNAATAVKPAKTVAVPAEASKPEQPLRAVQVKKFPPSSLKTVGFGLYDTLTITAPVNWDYEDVLAPEAWTNVVGTVAKSAVTARPDMLGSLIEVRRADHAWYAQLYITGITYDALNKPSGIELVCIGPAIGRNGKMCPIDLKTGGALEIKN